MDASDNKVQSIVDWFKSDWAAMSHGSSISESCLTAPRRKAKDPSEAALAREVAALLYPSEPESLSTIIKYDSDMRILRNRVRLQRNEQIEVKKEDEPHSIASAVRRQGRWDEKEDSVTMPPAIPMPVEISSLDTLMPFFDYLETNVLFQPSEDLPLKLEPYYGTPFIEFQKGIVYEDGRMDLCKKVLGPPNVSPLLNSLSANSHVKHFLLGNNIIGPSGCRRLAKFIERHPERIQTWYLAGNCIDRESFTGLAKALTKSETVHSVWLKRNPLTSESGAALRRLIVQTKNLTTLDLDQTELADEGVVAMLSDLPGDISLRHLYLNGNGISSSGCAAISSYLSNPRCGLESLFLSVNPIGCTGCTVLAPALAKNKSLKRLSISSGGITSPGAIKLFEALKAHPTLQGLHLGQNYATIDLGQRFNWLDDEMVEACEDFLRNAKALRYLNLGLMAVSYPVLARLAAAAASSTTLCYYDATSIFLQSRVVEPRTRKILAVTLRENVKRLYDGLDYNAFLQGELRFLRNTREVRYIDSLYRNRDMQKARRGEMVLDKWWEKGSDAEVLKLVMSIV